METDMNNMDLPDDLVAGTSTLIIEKQPQLANGISGKKLTPTTTTIIQAAPQKIAPKPVISTQKSTQKSGDKIVLIQGPDGIRIPVKLVVSGTSATSSATASTATAPKTVVAGTSIQNKMATILNQQKKIVPAKPPTPISSTQLRAVVSKPTTPTTTAPKVIVTTTTGKVVQTSTSGIRITPRPTITTSNPSSTSTNSSSAAKTVSASEAKVMEFIRQQQNAKKKLLLPPLQPKASPITTTLTSPGLTSTAAKVSPAVASSSSSKPTIKISSNNNSAPTGQPQLQTINIPGKNVQYVRLLNPQPNTTIAIRTANGQQKILPAPPPGKVIIQKPGQQISIVNNNAKPTPFVRKSSTVEQADKPTEGRKMIAVFRKGDIKSGMIPEGGKVSTLTTSQLSKLKGAKIISTGENNKTNIVMLPADYMKQLEEIKANSTATTSASAAEKKPEGVLKKFFQISTTPPDDSLRKRTCNCTKSQCLKLYCDCFANGEFCGGCNCKDCFNTMANETDRNEAIQLCLERNPHAFKPKVTKGKAEDDQSVRHSKGCNCKKSNCLKNYCECYEAKVACSGNCKCIGCRNDIDGGPVYPSCSLAIQIDKPTTSTVTTTAESSSSVVPNTLPTETRTYVSSSVTVRQTVAAPAAKLPTVASQIAQKRPGSPLSSQLPTKMPTSSAAGTIHIVTSRPTTTVTSAVPSTSSALPKPAPKPFSVPLRIPSPPATSSLIPTKQPYNFMTQDVIEATVQCMIAQADDCQKRRVSQKYAEKMILEEFGRCLVEIIEFSSKNEN